MRNIHIFHVFSTFCVGGPQRRFAELANAMPEITHTILAMDGRYDAMLLIDDGISCCRCSFETTKNGGLSFGNIKTLRSHIKDKKADILCTYNWGSIEAVIAQKSLWGLLRKSAHLHFEDGFGPDESPGEQVLRRALMRRVMLRGSTVIVPSKVLQHLAVNNWKLPLKSVQYIPNGVDIQHYILNRIMPLDLCIGSVGVIRREKNIPFMLSLFEAINGVIDVKLSIVGHGPEFDNISMRVRESSAQEKIQLLGHHENPAELYQEFDIFLITSDTEQMPLSVLEAMSSGLPVVATNVGDIKSMLSAANAPFVCEKGDRVGLQNAILTLLENPELRASIGRQNRIKVEKNFTKEAMLTAYRDLFESMAS